MYFHIYGCGPADMSTHISTHTTHNQSKNMYLSTEWERKVLSWCFPWYWHWCLSHIVAALWVQMKRLLLPGTKSPQGRADTSARDALPPSQDKLSVIVKCRPGKSNASSSCPRLRAHPAPATCLWLLSKVSLPGEWGVPLPAVLSGQSHYCEIYEARKFLFLALRMCYLQ